MPNPNFPDNYDLPGRPVNPDGVVNDLPTFNPPSAYDENGNPSNSRRQTFDEMVQGIPVEDKGAGFIPASSIHIGNRFNYSFPYMDHEEAAARSQSATDKWANGLGKFLGTTLSTAVQGTVGTVYGLGQYVATGRFSSVYDNPVNRYLDDFNKQMEDYLPNYYTHAEKDASWYSPDNVLTANFWSDKVLKNLGFSAGTLLGGFGWGAAFKAIGLTSKLVQAGQGLKLLTAIDEAMAAAPRAAQFGNVTRTIESVAQRSLMKTAGKVLTNADRTMTSIMGSMGEASIESLQNMNEFRDRMIDDYIARNGVAPSGADLAEINAHADKVGNFTWGMNVATLSATNYIQLGKILTTSRTAEKMMINEVVKESVKKGATTAEKVGAKHVLGKSLLEKALGKPGRYLDRYIVKPGSLLVAPAEGFEEFAQFSIQKGTSDYFGSAYDLNEDVTDFWKNLDGALGGVLGPGVHETLSTKEGMESVLIGTISGGLQTSFSPFGENTLKQRGLFGDGGTRGQNTKAAIDALNKTNLNNVIRDGVKYINIGINAQKKRQAAILNDDVLSEKDHELDYTMSYILPRVKYGKVDGIKQEIALYREQAMNPGGFSQLQADGYALPGEKMEKFLERLNKIEKIADQVNDTYQKISLNYADIADENGKRKYSDDVIERMTYVIAKVSDYDSRLEETGIEVAGVVDIPAMRKIVEEHQGWKDKDIRAVADDPELSKMVESALASVSASMPIENEDMKKKVVDFAEMLMLRQSFINDYQDIKNNPDNYKDMAAPADKVTLTEEEKQQYPNKTITIKTKNGEREIETNTEYLLSKRIYLDKNGEPVYKSPVIVILDENEDGTIKIKGTNGVIRDVSKEELEPYGLSKVDTLNKNKKAKYVYDNWNTIFEHHGIKDRHGKAVKGRIEYDKTTDKVVFTWKDENGNVQRKDTINHEFAPRKGWSKAKIRNVGTRTAVQEASLKEFLDEKDSLSSRLEQRNNMILDIHARNSSRVEEITGKMEANNKKLETIKKNLEEETSSLEDLDKKGKKATRKRQAIEKSIKELSALHEVLEQDNKALELEKAELESTLPYFQELVDEIEDLPDDTTETIARLKKDMEIIQELIDHDSELVSLNKNLLEQIEDLISTSLTTIAKFVEDFKRLNPGAPLTLEELEDKLEARLGEQGARQIIQERIGFAAMLMEFESELSAMQDEFNIPALSSQADKIREEIGQVQSGLDGYISSYNGMQKVVDTLQEYVDKMQQQKEEEEKLHRNEELKSQLIGTMGSDTQNMFSTKHYEPNPKKDQTAVVRGTMPIDDGKAHQARANRFGFLFPKMKNKDKIKGIVVTGKTEGDIIPGLIAHLVSGMTQEQKTKYKQEEIIAMVMVQVNDDGSYSLVGQDGKPLEDGVKLVDNAIYQTFPMDDLVASYPDGSGNMVKGTMFREGTDKDTITFLTNSYKEWRKRQLAKDSITEPEDIKVSFGIPQYVTYKDESGKDQRDYNARITAQDAGLLEEGELEKGPRVTIAVTNDSIAEGSVAFNTPKGRVFLRIPGAGLAKLFNRKYTRKEAETIYQVILQVAKNGVKKGEVSAETMELINWLKSVTYWGIAKDLNTGERKPAGYNNIWFENIKEGKEKVMKLFISGLSKETKQGINFTPSSLEENKHSIIALLQEMYHNTSASGINDKQWNAPYFEITGINEDGTPVYREWKNYQVYLLSGKNPDGSTRDKQEIPLVTQYRPVVDDNDSNRKAIYFVLDSDTSEFDVPKKEPKKAAPKKASTRASQEAPAKAEEKTGQKQEEKKAPAPQVLKLDGSKETYHFQSFGGFDVPFTFDSKVYEETGGKKGYFVEATAEAISAVSAAGKATDQDSAFEYIASITLKKILDQHNARKVKDNPPIEVEQKVIDQMEKENPSPVQEKQEKEEKVPVKVNVEEKQEEAPARKRISMDEVDAIEDHSAEARLVIESPSMETENWEEAESWLRENFPNLPVYRVKNMIRSTNGKQLWGMLQGAAIYLSRDGERGTVYHEVFEAVWKMFATPKEKESVIREFRQRQGSFTDRFSPTGRKIKYSEATAAQIKEELAEEFRDLVLYKKEPPRPRKGTNFVARLFHDLVRFIREFFTGNKARGNAMKLFEKIGSGYYAKYSPYETRLSLASKGIIDIEDATAGSLAEARPKKIAVAQVHEVVQHMTFAMLRELTKTNQSLFNIPSLDKSAIYQDLMLEILGKIKGRVAAILAEMDSGRLSPQKMETAEKEINNLRNLFNDVQDEWDEIVSEHETYLRTFGIEFDENDELELSEENKVKEDPYGNPRKMDSFRKANAAIRLLLGSLTYSRVTEKATTSSERKVSYIPTTIGGARLIPADQVHLDLLNNLHASVNLQDMMDKLRTLAVRNPNYEALYKRLTKQSTAHPVDYSVLEDHDWQLLSSFWKSMKLQNADTITIFILPNGEPVVTDSAMNSAAKQAKYEMFSAITRSIKDGKKYFSYSDKKGTYSATRALKEYKFSAGQIEQYTEFLKELGVVFDPKVIKKLSPNQLNTFRSAVEAIQSTLASFGPVYNKAGNPVDEDGNELVQTIDGVSVSVNQKPQQDYSLFFLTPRTLDIEGRLMQLALIKASIENPEYQSTYYNVNGEPTQTYVGSNVLSNFHDVISRIENINDLRDEHKGFSRLKYLLTDPFSQGSIILKRMFLVDSTGERKEGTENIMKQVFIDGLIDEEKGKKREASKLTRRQRLVMELNANSEGIYLTLVPGDSSLEYAVRMHDEKDPFVTSQMMSTGAYMNIFRDYFISEVNLSRDKSRIIEGKKKKDLRFFKAILRDKDGSDSLHDEITGKINKSKTPGELYEAYRPRIEKAVKAFVETKAADNYELLKEYDIVRMGPEGLEIDNLKIMGDMDPIEDNIKNKIKQMTINYMIANIELHKLIYSDPYRYSDELKRIKNFASPRQSLLQTNQAIRNALHAKRNQGVDKDDIAYSDYERDHFRSSTISDVYTTNDNKEYDKAYEETDGGGFMHLKAIRRLRDLEGTWTEANERQFRYDIAYEKYHRGLNMSEQEKYQKGLLMTEQEKELYNPSRKGKDNPGITDTYTPKKPIVTGTKANGRDYNDTVIHKFALAVLSYRILHQVNPDSNAIRLYDKMMKEDVDYVVFESGVKGGGEKVFQVYKNGVINDEPFQGEEKGDLSLPQGIINIPHDIISIQSEVPSKKTPNVTQGSQITKLITMDFLEGSVPVDFMKGKDFEDRFTAWLNLPEEDKIKASPVYLQIVINQGLLEAKIREEYKLLLKKLGIVEVDGDYKLTDKAKLTRALEGELLSREANINMRQALADFKTGDVVLEATPAYRQVRNILYSFADKNVVKPKLTGGSKVQVPSTFLESVRAEPVEAKTKKGKKVSAYQSDILGFYKDEDGERVCEIMVSRWFDSSMSDEELLHYLNETDEGRKILSGVAFRIPTQKQNSIDRFRIAKFLPKDYSDSVIIPSALVKKVGSDFDIDKLFLYFKNTYKDVDGKIKIIPFLGASESARKEMEQFVRDYFEKKPPALKEGQTLEQLIEERTDEWYLQSIENQYVESLELLVSHPDNYEHLVKPNSADDMQALSDKITRKLGLKVTDYSDPGNMLDHRYMMELRYAFVSGKYSIGIAAVSQTNNAQNQRMINYINMDVLQGKDIPEEDKAILGAYPDSRIFANNTDINFHTYNSVTIKGKRRPTLSLKKDKAGKNFLSDIIGQFIDGFVDISKDPWIIRLGAHQNVVGTWLFLVKIGVPINSVAYFMNQPIIRDYLKKIDNKGYSWLFIEDYILDALTSYSTSEPTGQSIEEIPSNEELFEMIGMEKGQMSPLQLAQQRYMLKEFIKYAKMSEHLLVLTQGSNFDTANLNDPFLVFKKMLQYEKARKTIFSSLDEEGNVIPAVDSMMEKSFIGVLKDTMTEIRDAFSTVLLSDSYSREDDELSVRDVIEKVLTPYVDLNDRDFIKVAQKAVADLFDWAMQTDKNVAKSVTSTLLGKDSGDKHANSYAREIIDFRDSILGNEASKIPQNPGHPLYNNLVIRSLRYTPGSRKGKPDNLYLAGRDNKVYNQDMLIGAFEELRKYLADNDQLDTYRKLVAVAVMQSGLKQSTISFTHLLPYRDFKEIYHQSLSRINKMPNLSDFHTTSMFERVNWNNEDIVPVYLDKATKSKKPNMYGNYRWFFKGQAFVTKGLKKAMESKEIPMVVELPTYSTAAAGDFVVYTWIDHLEKNKMIKAKKTGDTSHVHKALMKKVYEENEEGVMVPKIVTTEGKNADGETVIYYKYVFKAINALGDSFRAQEFPSKLDPSDRGSTLIGPSSIDNGFIKVAGMKKTYGKREEIQSSGEVEDETILYFMENTTDQSPVDTNMNPGTITSMKLRDGFTYTSDVINGQMLEKMGYTPDEIGDLLDKICV